MPRSRLAATFIASLLAATASEAAPLLLISIDGLRPGDVIEAEERHLSLPNLRQFVEKGAYASGVIGVLPTVTYPSHTTLLTGVAPARHGIVSNTTFDPMQINAGGWYWYASDIKVPTLWETAHDAGRTVANVHWPVSVGAAGVDWNVPQIWRSGHGDDAKLIAALATPGLLSDLEQSLGSYAAGIDESVEGDALRGRFAERIIATKRPDFITVYLTALDHEQHLNGPGSSQAHEVLERIDAVVGKLIAAERAARPDAVVAIVSDHGFETISREVNFYRAFIDAGLIRLGDDGKVTGWEAMPWNSGGSVAIVLARRDDATLRERVAKLLAKLKDDPKMGIRAIVDRKQIDAMGGNPEAAFYLDLQPDVTAGSFDDWKSGLVRSPKYKGMHGYFPAAQHLRSTFMIAGPGIAAGKSLSEIDMRAIAPTLARVMDLALPSAELQGLNLGTAPSR